MPRIFFKLKILNFISHRCWLSVYDAFSEQESIDFPQITLTMCGLLDTNIFLEMGSKCMGGSKYHNLANMQERSNLQNFGISINTTYIPHKHASFSHLLAF